MTTLMPAQTLALILQAFDHHDLDALARFTDDNIEDTYLPFGTTYGKEASLEMAASLWASFPDFRIRMLDVVGNERIASARWEASGTFTGEPFQGIHATGKHVKLAGCDFMEFSNGRVIKAFAHFDGADFARQIGLLPSSGSLMDAVMLHGLNAVTDLRGGIGSGISKVPDLIPFR